MGILWWALVLALGSAFCVAATVTVSRCLTGRSSIGLLPPAGLLVIGLAGVTWGLTGWPESRTGVPLLDGISGFSVALTQVAVVAVGGFVGYRLAK